MRFRKRIGLVLASLVLALSLPGVGWTLSIGTFNIEYFTVSGKKAYVDDDLEKLADAVLASGADVLALQEIGDGPSLRYFLQKTLPGWKYVIHDRGSRQDLAFIWNDDRVRLLDGPTPYYQNASFLWKERSLTLFDRPPLVAVFLDREADRRFTLVNVHLKSQSTQGKRDKVEALIYNETKRGLQILKINELVQSLRGVRFVLGDYNIETVVGAAFPLLTLPEGHYSYDNLKVNIDHIGYVGIDSDDSWCLAETESAIERRSTKKAQHPDHDIVVLHFRWPSAEQGTAGHRP